MKVEIISKDKLVIYINNIFFRGETWDSKEDIVRIIKNYIIRLKNNYHIELKGFYKVKVFLNKRVGTFVEMERLDDDYDNIELRIIVDLKEKLYFKFDDFDDIPDDTNYIYYDNYYYVDIDDIKDNILSFVEKGEIKYERSISDILWNGKKRKKLIVK